MVSLFSVVKTVSFFVSLSAAKQAGIGIGVGAVSALSVLIAYGVLYFVYRKYRKVRVGRFQKVDRTRQVKEYDPNTQQIEEQKTALDEHT
jgi:hypothetical protein